MSFATLNEIRTTILNAPPDCRLMSSGHRGASAIEVYIFIYNRVCSSLKVYIMSTIRSLYVDNHQSTDQYVRLIGTQYPVSLHTVDTQFNLIITLFFQDVERKTIVRRNEVSRTIQARLISFPSNIPRPIIGMSCRIAECGSESLTLVCKYCKQYRLGLHDYL